MEVQVQKAEKIQNNWVGSSMAFPLLIFRDLGGLCQGIFGMTLYRLDREGGRMREPWWENQKGA